MAYLRVNHLLMPNTDGQLGRQVRTLSANAGDFSPAFKQTLPLHLNL